MANDNTGYRRFCTFDVMAQTVKGRSELRLPSTAS
jgi:hypothetical protein